MNSLNPSSWYRFISTANQMPCVVFLKTFCFHLKWPGKHSTNNYCAPEKPFKCSADCLCRGWERAGECSRHTCSACLVAGRVRCAGDTSCSTAQSWSPALLRGRLGTAAPPGWLLLTQPWLLRFQNVTGVAGGSNIPKLWATTEVRWAGSDPGSQHCPFTCFWT